MRNFMASFNFLDDIGLRNLVDKIIQNFSTKSQTEDIRKSLSDRIEEVYQYLLNALGEETSRAMASELDIKNLILEEIERAQEVDSQIKASVDAEVSRAMESESILSKGIEDLRTSLTEEVNRASEVEEGLKTSIENTSSKLDSEIEETKESLLEVDSRVTSLEERADTLEEQVADGAGAVKDVLMDGISIVRDRIAYIKKGDITGEGSASILTYPTIEDFPTSESEVPPDFTTLYLALDTKILYKWDGDSYSELGKSNIIVTDSLPIEGLEDVLYVKTPDYLIYQWANGSYREIGGKDEDLRNEFIIHKSTPNPHNITKDTIGLGNVDDTSDLDKPISKAVQEALTTLGNTLDTGLTTASEELRTHVRNKENPHNVTAELLGLGLVDNTRDLEKPISYAVQTALEGKVSYEDIKDTLASTETSKALSARQGSVLDGKISEINGTILSIGSVFHFKGTLSSEADLETVESPVQGDAWQIRTLDESGKDTSGIVFAYTDNGWVEISASVSDISTYVATTDEVYSIIDAY